jgi:wobble nucleotide-excising tRNase
MPIKQKSGITRVTLNQATFSNVQFEPTYINFFYGRNGTGKSTLAREIQNNQGIEWSPSSQPENYKLLVYDQDFINKNIERHDEMPSVFTINEENIEIQKQVKAKTIKKDELDKRIGEASEEIIKKSESMEKVKSDFIKACWDKVGQSFKTDFPEALVGKKNKGPFADAVLGEKNKAVQHDRKELIARYTKAFMADARVFPLFVEADLNTIPACDLLNQVITSSSDSEFSRFMKALQATDWVRHGHEQYAHIANGKCPYCQQPLSQNLEEEITSCFDEQYQKDLDTLNQFRTEYRDAALKIYQSLKSNTVDVLPDLSLNEYTNLLDSFGATIKLNLQKIDDKIKEPSKAITLEDISKTLRGLNNQCSLFNKAINDNNEIVGSKQKSQNECKRDVWELIAYELQDDVSSYKKSIKEIGDSIETLQNEINEKKGLSRTLGTEIVDLNKGSINTSAAVDSINSLLKDSGFQGFKIQENEMIPNTYQIVRFDGSPAERLSEAEKNFIAFLYFCQLVRGKEKADELTKERIVVIDDPVSSMDSSVLFIVAGLVREMVEVCYNNGTFEDSTVNASYIHQIFIMTHNTYFHREITYNQVDRFKWVSFFIVSKVDNHSSIKECVRQNKERPTDLENYNPVQNSYAALWSEYKEVQSSIPVLNVIRRILEYYFLQICGYVGTDIRKTILEDHKDAFIQTDDNGNQDFAKYHMASAMLSYLNTGTTGIVDGVNYVDDCVDVEQCRTTFEMIFLYMGQSQHFNMMMGL